MTATGSGSPTAAALDAISEFKLLTRRMLTAPARDWKGERTEFARLPIALFRSRDKQGTVSASAVHDSEDEYVIRAHLIKDQVFGEAGDIPASSPREPLMPESLRTALRRHKSQCDDR
jgi:hypothetical protein